jgi:hypothetical protein
VRSKFVPNARRTQSQRAHYHFCIYISKLKNLPQGLQVFELDKGAAPLRQQDEIFFLPFLAFLKGHAFDSRLLPDLCSLWHCVLLGLSHVGYTK